MNMHKDLANQGTRSKRVLPHKNFIPVIDLFIDYIMVDVPFECILYLIYRDVNAFNWKKVIEGFLELNYFLFQIQLKMHVNILKR